MITVGLKFKSVVNGDQIFQISDLIKIEGKIAHVIISFIDNKGDIRSVPYSEEQVEVNLSKGRWMEVTSLVGVRFKIRESNTVFLFSEEIGDHIVVSWPGGKRSYHKTKAEKYLSKGDWMKIEEQGK